MRRRFLLFLSFALAGCGARTGLAEELTDGGAQSEASTDAKMEADAPVDARVLGCPLTPPMPNTTCALVDTNVLCAYTTSKGPLAEWFCIGGGWVNDTSACAPFECGDINCSVGNTVECVVGDGKQCCFCSSPMGRVDDCGPCPPP
jgi:hypothetical protein